MNQSPHLMTINLDSEIAVERVVNRLTADGLQVIRSFDLQTARAAHVDCTCPHHGTKRCDCQMVVLLVYDSEEQPLTLVAHGKDGQTHFSIVITPQEKLYLQSLKRAVVRALALERYTTIRRMPT